MPDDKNKFLNDEGIINLTVRDDSQILSPYSQPNKPVISEELADYLENQSKAFRPKAALSINVYSDCIDDDEKKVYDKAIRNYFSLKLTEAERDAKRKTAISLVFTAIGVFALVLTLILTAKGLGDVIAECLDIFAWVFLWEAVDQYFIERKTILFKRKRYETFVLSKISFFKESENQTEF